MNPKNAFWQALLSAVLIFGVGLILGVYLENSRNQDVEKILLTSEVNVADSQLMGQVIENFDVGCNESQKKTIQLADRIYSEAQLLEKYEQSSQLTDILEVVHRKYDLLRMELWSQSINLNKKCGRSFNTVVYIYQYKEPNIALKSEQVTFSRVLEDLKNKYGNKILLIPIAGDLNLDSIDLAKSAYSVKSYPTVIVNEGKVITNIDELKEIDNLLLK